MVWSWSASSSATMFWSWSNEKNGDWGESDWRRFDQAACGSGLMLIGSSGSILISEFIGYNGLILIKWEKWRLRGEWSAAIWSGGVWFDADLRQCCDVDRRQSCDVDRWSSSCSSRDVDHGEWSERESELRAPERKREREREKNTKIFMQVLQ